MERNIKMKNEIIKGEIVESNIGNELTIHNPEIKKIVQIKEENKIKTTIVTTNNTLLQQTNYTNGVKTQRNISVPIFSNNQERDSAIVELCKDSHTQQEVADATNLSQSRISQIVNKNKKV
ncbi:hypothetical protein Abu_0918 [Aliarcobacter butzleri RM4018]|uniref:Uncharacterized protein n=2 Tax=Aliarcobacter butzleri TaxID=28197 RepID=A8ETA4_ALIB4|nr:hypothetical protein Abu_0918 [Aliarcobacter butzleri RM4018]